MGAFGCFRAPFPSHAGCLFRLRHQRHPPWPTVQGSRTRRSATRDSTRLHMDLYDSQTLGVSRRSICAVRVTRPWSYGGAFPCWGPSADFPFSLSCSFPSFASLSFAGVSPFLFPLSSFRFRFPSPVPALSSSVLALPRCPFLHKSFHSYPSATHFIFAPSLMLFDSLIHDALLGRDGLGRKGLTVRNLDKGLELRHLCMFPMLTLIFSGSLTPTGGCLASRSPPSAENKQLLVCSRLVLHPTESLIK